MLVLDLAALPGGTGHGALGARPGGMPEDIWGGRRANEGCRIFCVLFLNRNTS